MIIFTETDRTILREITTEDLDDFFEMDSDPELHRYLGTQPVMNRDQIIETIHYVRQQYIDNGIGRWAIADKSTNRFMGWTGFKLVKDLINNQTDYYDLGYRLIRKYWGKGYATETAKASLDYGFANLNTEQIIATVNCENDASNNVMKKLGFSFVETFYLHNLKHNWYKMNKTEWTDRMSMNERSNLKS